MKTRGTSIVAGLAISALLLAACGNDGADETPTGGGSNPAPTGSESGEPADPVTITFQSLSDQPATIAITEEIVATWNSENPNIQVELVPAGWDGIYDKLITQFNGGAAPDIVHYETASIVPFARDGYLADLSELISPEHLADVPQGILDSVTVDGRVVAYPTELQSYVVFANTTLMAELGVEVPTGDTMTWDELRALAKELTTADTYGIGWGLRSPTAAFMTMAPGFGGKYFSSNEADSVISIGGGELAIPELVAAMAYEDNSLLPVTLTQSGGETLASFYAGDIALTIQGSFQAANIANDAPEGMEWTVLPLLEGSESADQAANPQTLSINIDSEHPQQAAAFIEYFTATDNLAALNEADALIPATTSAQEALATKLGGESGWSTILASGEHMVSAPYLYSTTYAQWKDTIATPAFQKFLAQEINLEGLRTELVEGWEQINH